jgi:hypothetical protein
MAGAPKFDVARIIVGPGRIDRKAYWEFSGRVSHGVMRHCAAVDGNLLAPAAPDAG